MSIFSKIKTNHRLMFRKAMFNVEGTALINMTYNTITDTYLIKTAKEIADKYDCKLRGFTEHSWWTEGRVIGIYATRDNYMSFCAEFCDKMENYIKDIEL